MIASLEESFEFCLLQYESFKCQATKFCQTEFPFEFRALEVALEAICSFLDARTRELETAAYPALDELTAKVTMACLTILLI